MATTRKRSDAPKKTSHKASRKLTLKKETLKDLTPKRDGVKGGARDTPKCLFKTVLCYPTVGCK